MEFVLSSIILTPSVKRIRRLIVENSTHRDICGNYSVLLVVLAYSLLIMFISKICMLKIVISLCGRSNKWLKDPWYILIFQTQFLK